jgi:hypothetical protein
MSLPDPTLEGRATASSHPEGETTLSTPSTETWLTSAASTLVPVAALIAAAMLWVRYGVDLPFFDDWRHFIDGTISSVALGDLFRPVNDTIYATGKLLDALAVRLLAYNGIVYQLLTMLGCIGLLLYLQHRLLFISLPWRAAALGMIACVFMIQPYTYWGVQNFAYHQVLPLIAVMSGLALTLLTRVPNPVLAVLVAVLSLLGGFAYISGAVIVTTTACVFFLLSVRSESTAARRLRFAGYGFAAGALCALPAQLWVIVIVQGGNTHHYSIPWTYPWTLEFWAFLLGVVGRTVGAQSFSPNAAISLSLLATVSFITVAIVCMRQVLRGKLTLAQMRIPVVYLTLFCGTGAYAILIAASRASHGATQGAPLLNWFYGGGTRFHFFWLTLMLPWVVGVGFGAVRAKLPRLPQGAMSAALSVLLVGYAMTSGVFNYASYYAMTGESRRADMNCIQEKILQLVPVICGEPGREQDLTEGLRHARSLDVSFTRQFLFRDELSSDGNMTLLPASHLEVPRLDRIEGASADAQASDVEISSNSIDPQLYFRFEGAATSQLENCRVMWVKGTVESTNDDVVQVFFTTPRNEGFTEPQSAVWRYAGGNRQAFSIRIASRDGFGPKLRIDPGNSAQNFKLSGLAFTCR